MQSTLYLLVRVNDTYNNYVELDDGRQLSVNNTITSVQHINRVGEVISAPKGVVVEEGDLLLFHHNICRESYGHKAKRRKSVFSIKDDVFYIPAPEVFMYMKKGTDEWIPLDPFVFIEPIPAEKTLLPNGLEVEEESYKGMKPLVGRVGYINKELKSKGVKKGDIVAFQQDSEHEYEIKGKLYYKMKTQDILAVI